MPTQTGLFPSVDIPLNSSVRKEDVPRLSAQHFRLLAAFRANGWRLSNISLMAISHRFGARLHELRRHGIDWRIVERDGGVTWYEMTPQEERNA